MSAMSALLCLAVLSRLAASLPYQDPGLPFPSPALQDPNPAQVSELGFQV